MWTPGHSTLLRTVDIFGHRHLWQWECTRQYRVVYPSCCERNAERLDPLSISFKLNGVEGCITKVRNIITYNLRGVMEICRLSQAKFGLGRTVCSKLSGVQSWVPYFTTSFPAGIVSPEGVHSVDALVLYGSTIYSVRGILFNGIKVRQNHTAADVFLNYLRYFTLIKSSPISDMRPIGEGLIKRKVFAGAHTI